MKQTKKLLAAGAALAAVAALVGVLVPFLRPFFQTPPALTTQPPALNEQPPASPASTTVSEKGPEGDQAVITLEPAADSEKELEGGLEVITFAVPSFLRDSYQPLVQAFQEANPSIVVQLRDMPPSVDSRQVAAAADTSFLMYRPPDQGIYYLDLLPFLESDKTFPQDDFWPAGLEACQDAAGRTYGLPISIDLIGIYYRKEAFEAAGLPYPQPGWTWEDFRQAVNQLAHSENGEPVYGFADDSFIETFDETLLSPRIGALLDETGGEIQADRLAGELQWYRDAVQLNSLYSGNIYPQQVDLSGSGDYAAWSEAWNEAWSGWHTLFVQRPPAMWKGRLDHVSWGDLDMQALPDGSLNTSSGQVSPLVSQPGIGWAPFPVAGAGQPDRATPAQASCAVISSGSAHPRAAWIWLKFLAEHPVIPEWSYAAPARSSLLQASGLWNKISPDLRPAVQYGLEHAWYGSPYMPGLLAANRALLQSVVEKVDLKTALQAAGSQLAEAPPPTPDLTPVAVDPPQPVAPRSETVIDFYPFLLGYREGEVEALAAEFQRAHPEITVQIAPSSSDVRFETLAGSQDCFIWFSGAGAIADGVSDLTSLLASGSPGLQDDFSPELLEEFSQDGKLLALPLSLRPTLVYYNADLLAERGLEPPANDWTFTDFIEMVQAAASQQADRPIYGLALDYSYSDIDVLLAGRNVRLIDRSADPPEVYFDDPDTQNFVQWLAGLAKDQVIYPVSLITIGNYQANFGDARQTILDGRVAFWFSWYAPGGLDAYQLDQVDFEVGVAPLPRPENNWKPRSQALGLYISSKAEHPQACWEWIEFLSESSASSFGVPARRSVRESESWRTRVGPRAAAAYLASLDQRRMPGEPDPYSLGPARSWWQRVLAEALNGGAPLPVLAELQLRADIYTDCLAASSEYQSGNSQQMDLAEQSCARQADPEGNWP